MHQASSRPPWKRRASRTANPSTAQASARAGARPSNVDVISLLQRGLEANEHFPSADYYFEGLPPAIAAARTDADGKFTLPMLRKGKFAVVARGTRTVGNKHEDASGWFGPRSTGTIEAHHAEQRQYGRIRLARGLSARTPAPINQLRRPAMTSPRASRDAAALDRPTQACDCRRPD